jgi:hypothetical protein
MSTRKAGKYLKVASGSYLVQAPSLLVPISLQFFHLVLSGAFVCLFVLVFALLLPQKPGLSAPPQLHKALQIMVPLLLSSCL